MKISLYLSPELVIQVHFGREDETLAPQGTSNASSREIYPKLYANSISYFQLGLSLKVSYIARWLG